MILRSWGCIFVYFVPPQRDQEEYERLMRGKKHKTRKVREAKREKTFLEKHWKNVAIVVGVVATILGLISIALYA